jgi:hypothetical protein
LSALTSEWSSQGEIERDILFREVLTSLAPDERVICVWKLAGFSSREIARHRRSSVAAVDALFWRVKQRIRGLYRAAQPATKASETRPIIRARRQSLEHGHTDEVDG